MIQLTEIHIAIDNGEEGMAQNTRKIPPQSFRSADELEPIRAKIKRRQQKKTGKDCSVFFVYLKT